MRKTILFFGIFTLLSAALFSLACSKGADPTTTNPIQGQVLKTVSVGDDLNVTIYNDSGKLNTGEQTLTMAFTTARGEAVAAGRVTAAAANFYMPAMGSMAPMNNSVALTTTAVPGVYNGKVKIDMPGEWQVQISYEGPTGGGKAVVPITVR